jgi:hypothetical protein
LEKVNDLLKHYRPDILIFEDCDVKGSRRAIRIKKLLATLGSLGVTSGLRIRAFSKSAVRRVFATFRASTREEIARVVAIQISELAPSLPPHRKTFMPEHYSMPMFEAAALALTYYYSRPVRGGVRIQARPDAKTISTES